MTHRAEGLHQDDAEEQEQEHEEPELAVLATALVNLDAAHNQDAEDSEEEHAYGDPNHHHPGILGHDTIQLLKEEVSVDQRRQGRDTRDAEDNVDEERRHDQTAELLPLDAGTDRRDKEEDGTRAADREYERVVLQRVVAQQSTVGPPGG
jgi:hypothetical protein